MMVFTPFFETAVICEANAVIFGVHSCQMPGLVLAFWQLGDHFGTLGAPWEPWEQQTGLLGGVAFLPSERMLGVSEQSLSF